MKRQSAASAKWTRSSSTPNAIRRAATFHENSDAGWLQSLGHRHFVAALVVADVIHEGAHEHDAAAVGAVEVSGVGGIGKRAWIEAWAFVANLKLGLLVT